MAANDCWISVEVSTIALKREESFILLLGRLYSQNPAETVEKTAINLVVQ